MSLLLVAGIIAVNLVLSASSSNPADTPGVGRGDIQLIATDLPSTINDWIRQDFHPPIAAENLPENQYWWTHTWKYKSSQQAALVSFDQANWEGWHELTECYLGQGWELKERKILQPSADSSWPCVLAKFSQAHENLIVVFSMFYEDGDVAVPRDQIESFAPNPINQRLAYSPHAKESLGLRMLQCQISIPHLGKLSSENEQSAIRLHQATRDKFRQRWILDRPPSHQ